MRWLARFAFVELRLHRLELVVFPFNLPAHRCYENAGFTEESYARDARRASDGTYWGLIYMARLSQ